MTFPVVQATATYTTSTWTTTHSIPLPSNIVSGELLLMFGQCPLSTNPTITDWTAIVQDNNGGNGVLFVYAKIADGTEGATKSITTAEGRAAAVTYRISDWDGSLSNVQGLYSKPSGAITAPHPPPSLSATWSAADALWFKFAADADTATYTLAAGANYGNVVDAFSTAHKVRTARRELNAATEQPPSWTVASGTYHNSRFLSQSATIGVLGSTSGSSGLTFTVTPSVSDQTSTGYTVGGGLAAQGQVYMVAVPHGDPTPSIAQIVAGKNSTGASAAGAGNASTTSSAPHMFSVTVSGSAIANNPSHDIHYVGRKPE